MEISAEFKKAAVDMTRTLAVALRSSPLASTGLDYSEKITKLDESEEMMYFIYCQISDMFPDPDRRVLIDLFWDTLITEPAKVDRVERLRQAVAYRESHGEDFE